MGASARQTPTRRASSTRWRSGMSDHGLALGDPVDGQVRHPGHRRRAARTGSGLRRDGMPAALARRRRIRRQRNVPGGPGRPQRLVCHRRRAESSAAPTAVEAGQCTRRRSGRERQLAGSSRWLSGMPSMASPSAAITSSPTRPAKSAPSLPTADEPGEAPTGSQPGGLSFRCRLRAGHRRADPPGCRTHRHRPLRRRRRNLDEAQRRRLSRRGAEPGPGRDGPSASQGIIARLGLRP